MMECDGMGLNVDAPYLRHTFLAHSCPGVVRSDLAPSGLNMMEQNGIGWNRIESDGIGSNRVE